jgi:hypothetical protein
MSLEQELTDALVERYHLPERKRDIGDVAFSKLFDATEGSRCSIARILRS